MFTNHTSTPLALRCRRTHKARQECSWLCTQKALSTLYDFIIRLLCVIWVWLRVLTSSLLFPNTNQISQWSLLLSKARVSCFYSQRLLTKYSDGAATLSVVQASFLANYKPKLLKALNNYLFWVFFFTFPHQMTSEVHHSSLFSDRITWQHNTHSDLALTCIPDGHITAKTHNRLHMVLWMSHFYLFTDPICVKKKRTFIVLLHFFSKGTWDESFFQNVSNVFICYKWMADKMMMMMMNGSIIH